MDISRQGRREAKALYDLDWDEFALRRDLSGRHESRWNLELEGRMKVVACRSLAGYFSHNSCINSLCHRITTYGQLGCNPTQIAIS
jgi:hypothetical protein